MSTSQQLLRKLLKAHTSPEESTWKKEASKKSSSNRKRKKDAMMARNNDNNDRIATEEDVVECHANILLATDRAMAVSVDSTSKSSKSNAAAFRKLVQRREQKMTEMEQRRKLLNSTGGIIGYGGSARSSTSTLSQKTFVKIPTYNKERHEKERKEKKRMKLAKALERMNTTADGNNKKKKPKKTIFG